MENKKQLYVAFDLDGVLVENYAPFDNTTNTYGHVEYDPGMLGKPVESMWELFRYIHEHTEYESMVLTARVSSSHDPLQCYTSADAVRKLAFKKAGFIPKVSAEKTGDIVIILDDRAVEVAEGGLINKYTGNALLRKLVADCEKVNAV